MSATHVQQTASVSQTQYSTSSTGGNTTNGVNIASFVDIPYVKTLHFICRVLIFVFSICGSISAGWRHDVGGRSRFFQLVAGFAIGFTIALFILYFFKISHRFNTIAWTFIEMIIDGVFAVLYLISSALCADMAVRYSGASNFGAAAFFGFAACIVLILEGIWNLVQWQRGIIHRSGSSITTRTRVVRQNETVVTGLQTS